MSGIMVDSRTGETQPFPTIREVLERRDCGLATVLSRKLGRYWWPGDILADLGEFAHWHVTAENPYSVVYFDDATQAADETNWDALAVEAPVVGAGAEGLEDALAERAALVGDRVLVVAPDQPDLDDLARAARRLADYPLLDEEAHSAREHEAWCDLAPQLVADEIRGADGLSDHDHETLLDAAFDLAVELSPLLSFYDGFSGSYSPTFVHLLEKVGEWVRAVIYGEQLVLALEPTVARGGESR